MRISLTGRCVCLLLAIVCRTAVLQAARLPLLDLARTLECGDDAAAAQALEQLAAAPHPLGVPDAQLSGHAPLSIAVVDLLLDALAQANERHPALRGRIETLVHTWQYCDLGSADAPRDLEILGDTLVRRWPAAPLPLAGRGFRAWGLWPGASDPPPLAEDRCHTPTSLFDYQPSVPSGPLRAVAADERLPACHPPPSAPATPPVAVASPPPLPEPPRLALPHLNAPERHAPSISPSFVTLPSANAGALAVAPPRPGSRLALSGSVSYSGQFSGSHAMHANLAWAPLKNFSVKVGVSYKFRADGAWLASADNLSWAWGVGYEDSRPGTLSVQLNNWGPLRFKANLDFLKKAVLDVRYKVPFPAKVAKYLSLSVGWSQPLQAAPAVGITLSLQPFGHFTAFLSYRIAPFDALHVTWSYGVGYQGAAPYRLSISVNNWGPNKLTEFGLVKRGEVDIAWSWSF